MIHESRELTARLDPTGYIAGFYPHLLHLGSGQRCVSLSPVQHIETYGACAETISALQAFRKRHADAQRIHATLKSQPTTVDIAQYRSVLKNQAIVDEAEKLLNGFKPATYDVASHVKAIGVFEAKAVSIIVPVLSSHALMVFLGFQCRGD